jgi:hypothetical protein
MVVIVVTGLVTMGSSPNGYAGDDVPAPVCSESNFNGDVTKKDMETIADNVTAKAGPSKDVVRALLTTASGVWINPWKFLSRLFPRIAPVPRTTVQVWRIEVLSRFAQTALFSRKRATSL